MPSKRPGQVRFEAWVPQDLYEQFIASTPNRTSWLRKAMADALGPTAPQPKAAPHRHRRKQTGTRWSAGTEIPTYKCIDCGADLNG